MATGKPYVDPALTQISQAYRNDQDSFIAEKIFPVVEVPKPTGIYFTYGKENLKKPVSTVRTGRGATPEASYSRTQSTFGPLAEHDIKDFITWQERNTFDNPLDPETDTTNFLMEQISIEKEVALATKLADTAQITQNTTLSGTSQWSDYANSNPFTDIQAGITTLKKNGLKAPNTAFMGFEAWAQLVNHPDLLDRVKYSSLGVLTQQLFLDLFGSQGITQVFIGQSVYDSAAEGVTASNGFAWGKHFWLGYVGAPNLRTVNGGFTLVLQNGRYVDRWDDQDEKLSWYRVNDFYEQKLVGVEAFYLIKNAVA
jgi:hypothetical protein